MSLPVADTLFSDGQTRLFIHNQDIEVVQVAGLASELRVTVLLIGTAIVQHNREHSEMTPLDMFVSRGSLPITVQLTSGAQAVTLLVHAGNLDLPANHEQLQQGHLISGDRGLGAVFAKFLMSIVSESIEVGTRSSLYFGNAITALLSSALCDSETTGLWEDISTPREALMLSVRQYIVDNLGNPELGLDSIAKAHHISVSYLQKLFGREKSSVTGEIRRQRLEFARRDLARIENRSIPVSQIGEKWGIANQSHFSRLFTSTFGMSPAKYRHAATRPATGPDPSIVIEQ